MRDKVRISSGAAKDINKLPEKIQDAVIESLHELKEDPYIGKKLSRELSKRYTYRIRAYRVIYKIREKDKIVEIMSAKHRSIAYQ